jgi:predicted nucleic acid-binding protein
MRVAVKDANVFIDMELMGLFDLWTTLGCETITTSMIEMELLRGGHSEALAYIATDSIEVLEPDTGEVEQFQHALDRSVSLQDASVLFVAMQRDAVLLTGDKRLRANAELVEVECHGSIWILDQLVQHGALEGKVAAAKLTRLLAFDGEQVRHLPRKTAKSYIQRWKKL